MNQSFKTKKREKKFWNRNKYTLLLLGLLMIGAVLGYEKVQVTNILTDELTNSSVTINYEHYTIHNGDHFFVCNFETLNNGESINFTVTTGVSKEVHMRYYILGTSRTEIKIYEGSSVTGGENITAENSNRNIRTVSTIDLKKNPTINDEGVIILAGSYGLEGDNKIQANNAEIIKDYEIILDAGNTTMYQIISRDDGNIISYCGEWYEK